jgi:tetratricopeptide (TPR) repeat protein
MRAALFLSFLLLPAAAIAQPAQKPAPKPAPAQKPQAQPKPVSEADLLAQLKKAESPEAARPIEQKLMAMFRPSGSPSIDLLMTRAETAAAAGDKDAARKLVDAITTIAPKYAEGWHARAALESAADNDAAAMVSLQKTVELNPHHFTAMVELGDMLEAYGDKAAALKLYRRALALNPQMEGAGHKVRELSRSVEGQDI